MVNWTEEQLAAHQAKMATLKEPVAPETFRQKLERLREQGFKARAEARANRPKPDRNQPNKTELRFEQEILSRIYPPGTAFGFQALKFLVEEGYRYTPDWVVWVPLGFTIAEEGTLVCYEVKGPYIWPDAEGKFRLARHVYPWVHWEAWQWKKGEWNQIWMV